MNAELAPTSFEDAAFAADWLRGYAGWVIRHAVDGYGGRYSAAKQLVAVQSPARFPDSDLWFVVVHYESLLLARREHPRSYVMPVASVDVQRDRLIVRAPDLVEVITPDLEETNARMIVATIAAARMVVDSPQPPEEEQDEQAEGEPAKEDCDDADDGEAP